MLTKLDGDARGGAALSVKAVTGKPVKFAGMGEKLEDIEALRSRPDGLADPGHAATVPTLIEKAEAAVGPAEGRRSWSGSCAAASFTLQDLLRPAGPGEGHGLPWKWYRWA